MKLRRRIFYGWVIVGITFLIMSIVYAIWYSFPLFYVPILDEFGWGRAETALIFSIGSITYGIGSAVAGALLDRFGPRKTFTVGAVFIAIGLVGCSHANEIWQFFLFWGVLSSFGVCTAGFVPAVALVSNWFSRRRATAVGIAQAGGRESFLYTPLVQFIILGLGWRNTYLVLAAVSAVFITALAQFLRHSPEDMGLLPDGETGDEEGMKAELKREVDSIVNREWAARDWTLRNAIKEYRFWYLFCVILCTGATYGIAMTHQVAFIVDIGFTAMLASFLLLIFGISSMTGRLCGIVPDILGREFAFTLACGGIILGLIALTLASSNPGVWMLYVYVILFGLFSGLLAPTYAAAAADIFQGRHFGAILGFANIGYGLGTSIGAWVGGYVFDVFGNYIPAFVAAMFIMASSCVLLWLASPRKIRLAAGRVSKPL